MNQNNRMMMKNIKQILVIAIAHFFATTSILAQNPISLDEAIKLSLQNNYGLQIARGEQEIAKLNNDLGSAGFLPQLKATAGNTWANNNIHQETNTGIITDKNNVAGSTANAAIGFTWTLFDGTKMFATHHKLAELEKLSEIKTQMAIEDLVYRVMSQYYSLVKIKQQITLSESLLVLYQKRKQVAEAKNAAGSSSGLEVLQAQADLNAQSATLLKLKSQYQQAQYAFGKLVLNNPQVPVVVNDSLNTAQMINVESVRSNLKSNTQIKTAATYLKISDFTSKEARSGYFPKVGLGASYNLASTDNAAGYLLNSQTYGPTYGFTASWNLFDGMAVKRSVKSAKIQQRIMQLSFDEVNLLLETALLSQFKLYESNLQIVTMEEQSISVAQTALTIAMEKYGLGMINDIQLKEVQRTFEDAQLRLITARYDVKISETELLKLQGLLIR
jgi:outer membrane protein TolC